MRILKGIVKLCKQFVKLNYTLVDFEEVADIYVINTCTVTNMSDRKSRQVLRQAKNMKIEFKDFDEEEFYAIYLMHISDYPEKSNDYNYYISMAKDWLEDDDVYYKGGDKVCSYLYHTVLGTSK